MKKASKWEGYSIGLRRNLESEVYRRLKKIGVGNGKRTPETYKVYQGIRLIDKLLNGNVYNSHRLSQSEYDRIFEIVKRLLPTQD